MGGRSDEPGIWIGLRHRRRGSAGVGAVLCMALVAGSCRSDDAAGPESVASVLRDEVVFLVQPTIPEAVMEALFQGPVVVDETGCIRLDGPDSATVVWPYGFRLEDGRVRARDGRVVGSLGGRFRLGGGEVQSLHEGFGFTAEERAAIEARCPGRYWVVGDVP